MLIIYMHHIRVYSIIINMSGDIEVHLGPRLSHCCKFSISHGNLNSISAHGFRLSLLSALCFFTHNFDIQYLSKTYLDLSIFRWWLHDLGLPGWNFNLVQPGQILPYDYMGKFIPAKWDNFPTDNFLDLFTFFE